MGVSCRAYEQYIGEGPDKYGNPISNGGPRARLGWQHQTTVRNPVDGGGGEPRGLVGIRGGPVKKWKDRG